MSMGDKLEGVQGLSWWRSGKDSVLPMQRAQVRSLVRELDPTCLPQLRSPRASTKEPACCN